MQRSVPFYQEIFDQLPFISHRNQISRRKREKLEEKKSTSTSSNIEWPQHALLVLPSTGKSLLLNNQHVYVAHVVWHAISKLTEETLLINTFPDVDRKINYHRRLLIDAAQKLMSGIPLIADTYDRLKEDMGFCDALGKLVCSSNFQVIYHTRITDFKLVSWSM